MNENLKQAIMASVQLNTPELMREFKDKLLCDRNDVLKANMHRINYYLKSLPWLPSIAEVVIFGVFVAIMFIVADIIHGNYINNKVMRESRCQRKQTNGKVTAIDSNGKALYTISYDENNKVSLACEQDGKGGNILNHYTGIKEYDPNSKDPSKTSFNGDLTCSQQPFTANISGSTGHIYYTGDELLVKYMTVDDTSFFTSAK